MHYVYFLTLMKKHFIEKFYARSKLYKNNLSLIESNKNIITFLKLIYPNFIFVITNKLLRIIKIFKFDLEYYHSIFVMNKILNERS